MDNLISLLTETVTQLTVFIDLQDRLGEGGRTPGGNEQACPAVYDNFRDTACSRGHNRQSARHRIQDTAAHTFEIRGKHKKIQGCQYLRDIFPKSQEKYHILHTSLFHKFIQFHPQRALSHDYHPDLRRLFLENLRGSDQILMSLVICQMSNDPHKKIFGPEVQLSTEISTG